MKVTINNLGKIKSAEVELRPITLLIGENNTNKSWTEYTIYALLRSLAQFPATPQVKPRISTRSVSLRINQIARKAALRISHVPASASVNVVLTRSEILDGIADNVTLTLGARQLADVLAVAPTAVKGAKASLSIAKAELERGPEYFVLALGSDGSVISGATTRRPKEGQSFDFDNFPNLFEELGATSLTFSFGREREKGWERRIKTMLLEFILEILSNVFALPAERKALVTLYRPLSEDRKLVLPLPLRHFINSVRNAEPSEGDRRTLSLSKSQRLFPVYTKLVEILGGQLSFEGSEKVKHLTFAPAKGILLPIQAASSMVRSLSGFAIAITNLGNGTNALVIDEPEMNAHPRAQLAIAEMMGVFANLGNIVIATTHSPYVVDHFNNLIAAAELNKDFREEASKKFVLKTSSAFVKASTVAAYELSAKGKLTNLIDADRRKIATTTFGDVSDKLENLYGDLLEILSR